MQFGSSFLPSSGWTLSDATMSESEIVIAAGGSASITVTEVENTNLLPDALLLLLTASSYTSNYGPTSFARIHILYEDGNTYESVLPIIDISDGFSAILYPSISNYDGIDVSAFVSITFTLYSSDGITLTAWSLAKSLNNALVTDTLYYGIRITTETGFEAIRSDNLARAYFNADSMAFQVGDGTGASWTNKLYYEYDSGTGKTNLVFDGELSATLINALSVLIAPNLYAGKATISELTVDQLETSTKVQNYLNSDTSDVNYIKIVGQIIQFITASTDGSATEQATDRNGNLLYWMDNTYAAAGTDETDYPVMQYTYTELTKLQIFFDSDGTYYVPKVQFGAGSGSGNNQKAFVYKDNTGWYFDYYSATGVKWGLWFDDTGIHFDGVPEIVFDQVTAIIGIVQLWVQDDTPVAAKINDVWVDTDDYSRYDITALSASTTLAVSDSEIITATGTITVTLHAATAAGIVKRIHNVGTGIVTISGTINGSSNGMRLFPGESIDLITDGSGWRA